MRKRRIHLLVRTGKSGIILGQEIISISPVTPLPPYRHFSKSFWIIVFLVFLFLGCFTSKTAAAATARPASRVQMKPSNIVKPGSIEVKRNIEGLTTVFFNNNDRVYLREISLEVNKLIEWPPEDIELRVNAKLRAKRLEEPVFMPINEIKPGIVRKPLSDSQLRTLADMKDVHHPTIVMEQTPDGTYHIMTTIANEAIVATTVPAMKETLTSNVLRCYGLGSPVNVMVRGMPPDKAEDIIAHVNDNIRRLPRGSAKAILIPGENFAPFIENLKLANCKIVSNGIRIDPNISRRKVEKGWVYKINAKLPTTLTGRGPQYLHILIHYAKELTQEIISAVYAKLTSIIKRLSPEVSIADIGQLIKYGLQEDFGWMGVDKVMISVGSGPEGEIYDIYISRRPDLSVERGG
jgi:hypothetical protein